MLKNYSNHGMNQFKENDMVCYCFQFTRRQIEDDYIANDKSLIIEKIASAKKQGGCDCAQNNPRGR